MVALKIFPQTDVCCLLTIASTCQTAHGPVLSSTLSAFSIC